MEAAEGRVPRAVLAWLALFGALGSVFVTVWPDSYQQDGGTHYLFARWAWTHPHLFVGVWARPLFTALYAIPALGGYALAKLFTVALCLATGWHTWRLARELGLARPTLAIPILLLQPCVLLLLAETMTEPLFALVFVIALRLHHRGRIVAGLLTASLLVLARPEGVFVAALWAAWVLLDRKGGRPIARRMALIPLLGAGALAWWIAALAITGDPKWIYNDWPRQWRADGVTYGRGGAFAYVFMLPEIAGFVAIVPFLVGLGRSLSQRRLLTASSPFLMLFAVHAVLWFSGRFGSAGYARYLVCVAPAIAILTLEGWNAIAQHLGRREAWLGVPALLLSLIVGAGYVDGHAWARDAWAIDEMQGWFRANPRPVKQLVWSQAYMCIVMDDDPLRRPDLGGSRDTAQAALEALPSGTLVFWDEEVGPSWFHLTSADIEAAGYRRLRSRSQELRGVGLQAGWFGRGGPRRQTIHLLYKE